MGTRGPTTPLPGPTDAASGPGKGESGSRSRFPSLVTARWRILGRVSLEGGEMSTGHQSDAVRPDIGEEGVLVEIHI
jgi:hypothetical protein